MLASLGASLSIRTVVKTNLSQVDIIASSFHTSSILDSRIKWRQRHKPFWQVKKLNKAEDSPITEENKEFIQQYIDKKYSGPLKEEFAPWSRGKWEPGSRRPGLLATKIGVQPLWLKNGKQIVCTMLHIQDNHVVKYTPRAAYDETLLAEKKESPTFTFPLHFERIKPNKKADNLTGFVTVGAVSTNPQKYTKDYCGLFSQSGLAPKRYLARFPVTDNGVIQPGTPLGAAHFRPGQYVDVYGRTMERGFQGVMKRWGFHGMPATHGVTKSHRRPGGIGSGRAKARVWPGQKMPGHVGGTYRWYRALRVWRINYAENVLYVSGPSVQGVTGSVLHVCDTKLYAKRFENNKRDKLTDGPTHFPTAYPDQLETLPEEEYCDAVHDFKSPSLRLV